MKYRLNEGILLEAGEDDLGITAPSASTNNQTNTGANNGNNGTNNGTNQNSPQTAPNENITDFKKAFAETEAAYKAKQLTADQYRTKINMLWSEYFQSEFKNPEFAQYVEQTISGPVKIEIKEYGFSETNNPFIAYLHKIEKIPSIRPTELAYGVLHNAVVRKVVQLKDLRGNDESRLGMKNIIFSANLFDKQAKDIDTYLRIQARLLDNKVALDEIKKTLYTNPEENPPRLKPLDQIPEASEIAKKDTTINTKELDAIEPKNRKAFINLLLSQGQFTEKVAEAVSILKKEYKWADTDFILNVLGSASSPAVFANKIKAAGIVPANVIAAIRYLAAEK